MLGNKWPLLLLRGYEVEEGNGEEPARDIVKLTRIPNRRASSKRAVTGFSVLLRGSANQK